ncbi:hypothetical protein FQN57_006883 [Myotisia sp. PD_48]|nr:hypothetical protein FQN57_006883 [Myotisia sp. PD_48]
MGSTPSEWECFDTISQTERVGQLELAQELTRALEAHLQFMQFQETWRRDKYKVIGASVRDIGSPGHTPQKYRDSYLDFSDLFGQYCPENEDGLVFENDCNFGISNDDEESDYLEGGMISGYECPPCSETGGSDGHGLFGNSLIRSTIKYRPFYFQGAMARDESDMSDDGSTSGSPQQQGRSSLCNGYIDKAHHLDVEAISQCASSNTTSTS